MLLFWPELKRRAISVAAISAFLVLVDRGTKFVQQQSSGQEDASNAITTKANENVDNTKTRGDIEQQPVNRIVLVDVGLGNTAKHLYRPWRAELKKNGATEIIDVTTKHGGKCSNTLASYLKLCHDIGLEYQCFDWEDIQPSGSQHDEFMALGPVAGVIPGHEPSVEIADRISEMLKHETTNHAANATELSTARRKKMAMQTTIAKAGLQHIHSFFATDSDTALQHIDTHLQYPILLKPDRSSASVGVTVCNNAAEVQAHYNDWIGSDLAIKSGYFGLTGKVDGLVVQEFLVGQEFVVNMVSRDGKHVCTDMWEKSTVGKGRLYDLQTLCNSSKDHSDVIDYVCDVLFALGINHGPSHVEVMRTTDGPCCLIEVGARVSGGLGREHESVPLTTIEAIAMAYLRPENFKLLPLHYSAQQAKAVVFVPAPENPFINFKVLSSITSLPSYAYVCKGNFLGIETSAEHYAMYNVGWNNERWSTKSTEDLFSSGGPIVLAHDSQKQLDADVEYVQAMKHTLFQDPPPECYKLWMRRKADKTTKNHKQLVCHCQAWTHWLEHSMYDKVWPVQGVLNFTGLPSRAPVAPTLTPSNKEEKAKSA
jgi:D-alanine-D-alanine ligase-like ATP-grasp enzyme